MCLLCAHTSHFMVKVLGILTLTHKPAAGWCTVHTGNGLEQKWLSQQLNLMFNLRLLVPSMCSHKLQYISGYIKGNSNKLSACKDYEKFVCGALKLITTILGYASSKGTF